MPLYENRSSLVSCDPAVVMCSWDLGWALIERGGGGGKLINFLPLKRGGGLIVDLWYSHTLSQSKLLENHTQTNVISHRKRTRFISSAGLLSRSEFGDR